jgi:hypothetical protein
VSDTTAWSNADATPVDPAADPNNPPGGSGIDLSIFAKLGVQIETLAEQQKAAADRDRRKMDCIPSDYTANGNATVDAGADPIFIDLGQPSQGRIWEVRRIIVGATIASATATGSVFVFQQGLKPADLNVANLVDLYTLGVFPQRAFYGAHQFIVRPGEHIWVVVTGGTPGQQIVTAAKVEDWDEAAFRGAYFDA